MTTVEHSESVVVAASPEDVYDLVSDVTRTGEWSPVCVGCRWDDGATGRVGDGFTGRNVTPTRIWETRSRVVVADRGREFAWEVGDGLVRWAFEMAPVDGGTELTERWHFTPAGRAFFERTHGEQAPSQVADRVQAALAGIPATLARVAQIAEAG